MRELEVQDAQHIDRMERVIHFAFRMLRILLHGTDSGIHLGPDGVGCIKEHAFAVRLLFGKLHLHDELFSGSGCAEQVKCSVFVRKNKTMVLFIEPLKRPDLFSGEEQFNDFDQQRVISGCAHDDLEGFIEQDVRKSCLGFHLVRKESDSRRRGPGERRQVL